MRRIAATRPRACPRELKCLNRGDLHAAPVWQSGREEEGDRKVLSFVLHDGVVDANKLVYVQLSDAVVKQDRRLLGLDVPCEP